MKKYIFALLVSLVLLTTSCDSYLDKYPENVINLNEDVDYTKKENMFSPLAAVYSRAEGNSFSFWGQYGLLTVRGDDVNKGSSASDQGELVYAKIMEYNQIGGYWALNGSFKNLHDLVRETAAALEGLKRFDEYLSDPADKQLNLQYQAEARFLRAYAYFFIGRMWGKATFITNVEDVMMENPPVIQYDELFKYINEELDFCIANLPAKHPKEMPIKGQVTKYTALMLKAKANSDLNNWETVLSVTEEIINSGKFSLYPDFYNYFKKDGILADETLFELQYGVFNQKEYASDAWFAFQGPRKGFVGTKIEGGWGFINPTEELRNFMDNRNDSVRIKTTFLYAGSITPEGDELIPGDAPDGHDKVFNGKAYLPSSQLPAGFNKYGLGNSIRMLRYADCLLLNAEAKVHKGQNGDAPFNAVRARVKLSPKSNVTLDDILDERRAEFAMEWGERFFDLVRTNKAEGTLSHFVKGKNEFYPIPIAQSDLNPNLK